MGPLHGIKNMTYVLVPFCNGFVRLCSQNKSKKKGEKKKKTKYEILTLVLAGSQRHWPGPGSILNFGDI
jgi:hypothetical protein